MKLQVVERWLSLATPEQRARVKTAEAEASEYWSIAKTDEAPTNRRQLSAAMAVAIEVAILTEIWRVSVGQDGTT